MASLSFKVTRQPAVLVTPSLPTPKEILYLSNIDDQGAFRLKAEVVQFYRSNSLKRNEDPAKVIKEALGKVLVHYYPFAGRLRDAPGGKLEVDCTGEGVLFVEADADVALQQFGDLHPPFPEWDELLHDVPGSQSITNSPLLLIQVTRLRCGGFIFALRLNHTMADGAGLVQLMAALGEVARGAAGPSVSPVWKRETLRPRPKPAVNVPLYEYDQPEGNILPVDEMSYNYFFFGPREITSLKRQAGRVKCSTFQVLSACLWRLRTRALNLAPEQDVWFIFLQDTRSRFEPPLPQGYYGNAICFACAKTKAGLLANKPLSFAVEVINRAKTAVNDEYMRSVIDLMELKGRLLLPVMGAFVVSDLTRFGFRDVDYGWGKAVYGGPLKFDARSNPGTFLIPHRCRDGINRILVPMWLPMAAMQKFQAEMSKAMEHSSPYLASAI